MRTRLILAVALVGLAVGVRLAGLQDPALREGVGTENERVAVALADGRGWADVFRPGTGPTAHTAPLYPLLLAGVYRLCGGYGTEAGTWGQRVLTLTLTLMTLLMLPVLARKLGLAEAVGWGAAFAKACLVMRVEINGRHENVLAALALLGLLWCLADLRQREWVGRAAACRTGLLLGLAVLIYPNALMVVALFFLLEMLRPAAPRARVFRCGAVVAALSLCVVAPWLARNQRVLGGFVPLRSNLGLELAVGNRPGADGSTYAPGMEEMHPLSNSHERARLARLGELGYMRDKQRQALAWIAGHPGSFAGLTARRVALFYLLKAESCFPLDSVLPRIQVPLFLALAALAAAGLVGLLRRQPAAGRLLACTLLGAGLPYFVTHVEPRYRTPVQGLLLLTVCHLLAASAVAVRARLAALRAGADVAHCPQR